MALNKKGSGFGLDLEAKFKNVNADTAYTDADTDTDKYADAVKKETRSKRSYLLVKPSVREKIDRYAAENGDTFNNIVNTLLEDFVEKHGL